MRKALLLLLTSSLLCANESTQPAIYLSDTLTTSIYDHPPRDYFWFCFATHDGILVGKRIVWPPGQYDPRELYKMRQQTVALRYTAHNIWVIRTDGKEVKLKREESYPEFAEGCQKIANTGK